MFVPLLDFFTRVDAEGHHVNILQPVTNNNINLGRYTVDWRGDARYQTRVYTAT